MIMFVICKNVWKVNQESTRLTILITDLRIYVSL
jgi:hypothetical protein